MSKSAFGKIREGLAELADTAKEKATAGIETVVQKTGEVKDKAMEHAPDLGEAADSVKETGKGIFGRFSKAIKAFKE